MLASLAHMKNERVFNTMNVLQSKRFKAVHDHQAFVYKINESLTCSKFLSNNDGCFYSTLEAGNGLNYRLFLREAAALFFINCPSELILKWFISH